MPFVISEYGVPSSRGNAHLQPQGWSHGGHDETAMAAIDARLTREIRESGAAGAIVFAWMDEWFKRNWIVIDFEAPAERTRLWHNMMDAEQNYGILGEYAGSVETTPVLGGEPARWRALTTVASGTGALRTLRAGSDASYLYLALEVRSRGVQLGDGGHGAGAGHLPRVRRARGPCPEGRMRSEVGFEFLLDLRSPADATLRILPSYNPYVGESAILGGRRFRAVLPAAGDDRRGDRRPLRSDVRHHQPRTIRA